MDQSTSSSANFESVFEAKISADQDESDTAGSCDGQRYDPDAFESVPQQQQQPPPQQAAGPTVFIPPSPKRSWDIWMIVAAIATALAAVFAYFAFRGE